MLLATVLRLLPPGTVGVTLARALAAEQLRSRPGNTKAEVAVGKAVSARDVLAVLSEEEM